MTLPASGQLSLGQINATFGRGTNLNSYRGTGWWTDGGASGSFSGGAISFSEFYGKRPTPPVFYWEGVLFYQFGPGGFGYWSGGISVGPRFVNEMHFPNAGSPLTTFIRFPNGIPGSSVRVVVSGMRDVTFTSWDAGNSRFVAGNSGPIFEGNYFTQIWVNP